MAPDFKTSNFKFQVTTHSPEETRTLGHKMGTCLETGAVIALTGDLGSGKTVFVQGLAMGLGVPKNYYITSPTYTLINEYPGRLPLFHADLYRIRQSDDLQEIGFDEILNGDGVLTIEWADRLQGEILSDYFNILFEIIDDESRKICIFAYGLKEADVVEKFKNQITTA